MLVACQTASERQELTIAAAASLNTTFSEIGDAFTKESGIPVTFSFAATGTLSEQIRNGAPFDIFAAADTAHITNLFVEGYIIPESRAVFAHGLVSLVIAPDSGLQLKSLNDLKNIAVERFTIANPKIAPYGAAAQTIVENAGLWTQIEEHLVFGESVRQSLQYIDSGEIPAGIIPNSLLLDSPLIIIPIDSALYDPVEHGIGIIADSHHTAEAEQFLNFLFSPQGQAILANHGLIPVADP